MVGKFSNYSSPSLEHFFKAHRFFDDVRPDLVCETALRAPWFPDGVVAVADLENAPRGK